MSTDSLLYVLLNEINGGDDKSGLPNNIVLAIRRNIRRGAEDTNQNWANALELVHKAYDVAAVVRPDPSMLSAWKQYEQALVYAVKQLAKNRGMSSDWRMSASTLESAVNIDNSFKVNVIKSGIVSEHVVSAKTSSELLESFKNIAGYDVKINESDDRTTIKYYKWGIKQPLKVEILK